MYNTTHEQLKDPTAHRLENFWWHVWGSDRKNLSGATLARLFEHISEGPTFVPLRGPPNRYEGPPVCNPVPTYSTSRLIVMQTPRPGQHENDNHKVSKCGQPRSTQPNQQKAVASSDGPMPSSSVHDRTPSSARPPPSHSILKKPRGPSTSGPRPTARFVSPQESENEAEVAVSSVLSNTSIGRSPKPEKRSPAMTSKKFVVTSSASKRRPILPRRTSSQVSGSDIGSKDGASSSAGSRHSTVQGSVSPIPQRAALAGKTAQRLPVPRSHPESTSAEPADEPAVPSAKALGKRPVVVQQRPLRSGPRTSSTAEGSPVVVQAAPPMAEARNTQPPQPQQDEQSQVSQQTAKPSRTQTTSQTSNLPAKSAPSTPGSSDIHTNPRRTSRGESQHPLIQSQLRHRQGSSTSLNRSALSSALPPPVSLIASSAVATGATSRVAVEGLFDSEHQNESSTLAQSTPSREINIEPSRARTTYQPTFSPTPPKPTPPMPFGRTKSQLTLLLERDKERTKGANGRGQS